LRIAIVSQYYPPEPGATQNRLGAFAEGLAERGHEVTVVCEQPNHPSGVYQPGYGRRPLMTELRPHLTIRRLWVVTSPRKTTRLRLAFYGSFAAGAGTILATGPRQDVTFASSPPLPGALVAAAVARARHAPYVLDVRDPWPAAAAALGEVTNPRVLRVLERGAGWAYRNAACVTATTRPFCSHIDQVAGRPVSVHVPNGALDELLSIGPMPAPANGAFVVGYTGNLGIAQGLGIVFEAAERLRREDVRFVLVGDGPLSAELRAERDRRGLASVEIRPAVPVTEVAKIMLDCNALLVPLRAHPLLSGFVPSKLYDAMAVGRPAIVAAAGEAAALVRHWGAGVAIPPEDGAALAEAVRMLAADPRRAAAFGDAGRRAALEHARSRQLERLERVLADAAGSMRGRP
jgi:glycosyltransferase involved in cell wall biosynthesis